MVFAVLMGSESAGSKKFTYRECWWCVLLLFMCIEMAQMHASQASIPEAVEWSAWSSWTPCSRTCDGGITQQFRTCKLLTGCSGVGIQRKICNIQPCSEYRDYKDEGCKVFDGDTDQGIPRIWKAVDDPEQPCLTTCMVEGTELIAKLSPKLNNGILCGGGLRVCLEGKCEEVGCDLMLGSLKTVDECGVCGGDGSSCTQWAVIPTAPCTAPCGGGLQEVRAICQNIVSGEELNSSRCNTTVRPEQGVQSCNIFPCKSMRQSSKLVRSQSKAEDKSHKQRLFCGQKGNSTLSKVGGRHCKHMPISTHHRNCSCIHSCSKWVAGPWSECSTTCGDGGRRSRNVVCRDPHNLPSFKCNPNEIPAETTHCQNVIPCATNPTGIKSSNSTLLKQVSSTSTYLRINYVDSQSSEEFDSDLDYLQDETSHDTFDMKHAYQETVSGRSAPSEPTFVVEIWSPCSQTCGEGIRRRVVNCKIFLEFTRTVVNLPDKECPGPKPSERESCFLRPCQVNSHNSRSKHFGVESLSDSHSEALADSDSNYRKTVAIPPGISMQDMTFSWRIDGYTPCSASCLGGVQERRITCVRDYDQRAATPVLCMDKPPPDIPTTQSCNNNACPPRWNVTEFGPCSKPCGGGVMTRDVTCTHEVTRGNTVAVPNNQCDQPVPRTERFCNTIDCPPFWEVGEWDRCSKPCGGGIRTREVSCKQIIALGQIVDRNPTDSFCSQPPPSPTRPCNMKPCRKDKGSTNSSLGPKVLQNPKRKNKPISVRGDAIVPQGAVLKLICSTPPNTDLTRLGWTKDFAYIHLQPRKLEIIPRSGILKIKNAALVDSGIYSCLFNGQSLSNLTLTVQPSITGGLKRQDRTGIVNTYVPATHNRDDRIYKPRELINEQTHFYPNQQPEVPTSDVGHESRLLNPNTKLFSGSSSSGSRFLNPFEYIYAILIQVVF